MKSQCTVRALRNESSDTHIPRADLADTTANVGRCRPWTVDKDGLTSIELAIIRNFMTEVILGRIFACLHQQMISLRIGIEAL